MLNSNSLLKAISKRLLKRRLFYVCRDVERAIGVDLTLPNYYIITNYSEFSAKLAQQHPNIILINEKEQLDTRDLLAHTKTKNTIKKNDFVLVFKNNALIESQCRKNGWKLLNPSSKLADKVESKISQVEWLGGLVEYLPPHQIDICGNVHWGGKSFILQFNHSHTGSGTFFIDSDKKLSDLKAKFSKREVRITDFIKGPVFTNNNAVWGNKILTGNISYQITGLSPFTDNKFATIGNDWALPHKILSKKQILQYKKIASEVGKKLSKDGWKGLYGVDIIVNDKSGQIYLLEINARQPASTTCESLLQKLSRKSGVSTFEAHLASLLGLPSDGYKLIPIDDGAQIVQRVTNKISEMRAPKIKDNALINIIKYNNTLFGSDLIRFQFSKGLMKEHNVLNAFGKKI
ncbi:MAG: Uncharacterized protein G01um101413_269 [Parcubacteria group bacterium Gr01-1014_13]|nr:MAG: Uncharacterized protein G01um101413_269 [Parcubacteria group bacterium Gr01-1014_13]